MLGDDEHPISFRFDAELRGEHVHVAVRAGLRPNDEGGGGRALCGTLVMRPEEWALLRMVLVSAPAGETEATRRLFLRGVPHDLLDDPTLGEPHRSLRGGVRIIWADPRPFELHGFPELADEHGQPRPVVFPQGGPHA